MKTITSLVEAPIGEWFKLETVDEFGDPTGKTVDIFKCEGTFNNSDEYESLLRVTIKDVNGAVILFLNNENFSNLIILREHELWELRTKQSDGTKRKYVAFASPSGQVEIHDDTYFKDLLYNGKKEKVEARLINTQDITGLEVYAFSFITKTGTPPIIRREYESSKSGCAKIIITAALLITLTIFII